MVVEVEPAPSAADPSDVFYLWPENVEAWELWLGCQSRWRGGGGMGASRMGLDLAECERVMRAQRIPRKRWPQRERDLLVMERAALQAWARKAQEHMEQQQQRASKL